MKPTAWSPKVAVPLRKVGGRPGPDRRRWVVRPDDLLVLAFDLVNLEVALSAGEGPAQLVRKGTGQAYLIAWFPPQHLVEKAYFTTVEGYPVKLPPPIEGQDPLDEPDEGNTDIEEPEPAPIDAILAGWSRLAFVVPDGKLPIDWTLEGVLAAMRDLELSVAPNALPPKAKKSVLMAVVSTAMDAVQVSVVAGMRPASSVAAAVSRVARDRRKVRTIGNTLGITMVTGSATRELARAYVEELLGPGRAAILIRPEPRPPTATQTALELPYRIILSPNRHGAWFHVDRPMTSPETGHTELWHTRLGTRRPDGTLVDGDDPLRTLRAVWTTDSPPDVDTPPPGGSVEVGPHANHPWRMSLDTFDRHNVVHLSSNFRLRDGKNPKEFYEPSPLDVDLLTLTSLGAWLDSRGAWDYRQPDGLSVEEWRHRATLGRDHYVRVVYAGFLFPFGHRASVVKITERQFHGDMPGNPAYLRQRMFLVVREPLKSFRNTTLRYDGEDDDRLGEQYALMMPFETVRILTRVSPLLDPPETDDVLDEHQSAFWPSVGKKPFLFHVNAIDTDGGAVDMAMPLIFVGKERTDAPYAGSIITKVAEEYEKATTGGARRATVPLAGQNVAFAESANPGDTSFAVRSLTFGAEVPASPTYDALPVQQPRFFPVVRKAQIDVPALQKIARTSTPASVVYENGYLVNGFGGPNPGGVFLAADPDPAAPKLGVAFSSQGDRSGGLVTPDMTLSGLSRMTGPVSGDLKTAAAGSFNAKAWFGAIAGAKLFGVLGLSDILYPAVGFGDLDAIPRFTGEPLSQVEEVIAGLERLQRLLTGTPPPGAGAAASLLDQLLDPATGSIPALLDTGDTVAVASQLAALKSEFSALAAADLPSGRAALVGQTAASLEKGIDAILGDLDLLARFADGDLLPKALNARFEWRPVVQAWGPFKPDGDRNLVLSVEAVDGRAGGDETFTVTCALNDFVLDLAVLVLDFERVQIQAVAGKKMDVDVRFRGFQFAGPLSFVQTLKELIPADGFSDPPDVEVTTEGISAGFTMGLPNIAIGVFSLENLSLGAGFSVPFVGLPVSTWFKFSTRENPSRLTVSLFGGGFYLGITVDANGVQVLEGAIEFGAAISVDFGVASGGVSAMAGLYFKIEGSEYTLAGYFRLRGEVEVLGVVSVSIELYLEMRYESSCKFVGTATLTIEVDVALFSTTVEISCTKKFAGAGADPTLAEVFDVQPDGTSAAWDEYCRAFA